MKLNLDHFPRRLKPTPAEAREIRGALHLRSQLPPGDPNHLATADGAKNSWGGALMWSFGRHLQDSPGFLFVGVLCLVYVLIVDPLISIFGR